MSITITLAGKPYTVSQLTLGQLRDLSVGVTLPDTPDPQEVVRRSFERAASIIVTALRDSNPDLTVDSLYKLPITRDEMRAANDAILKFSGLIPERRSIAQLHAEIAALEGELKLREAEEKSTGEGAGAP